ncbi:hypothetical protein KSB_44840 [Ktedonobacter robiniae]|uniref:Uncharacterized protein n=1 Tax=Ktedonobacter robiniae TaxID=2778365 RepID=A0ABQ3UT54_9CHLR|nr:hypothetical protein KSB_44840 [Ktedonobacter robiniae]
MDNDTYLCRIDSTIPLADYRKRRSYYGRDMKVHVPDGNYQHFILSPSESARVDVYDGGGECKSQY